jgi:hypothetical protein
MQGGWSGRAHLPQSVAKPGTICYARARVNHKKEVLFRRYCRETGATAPRGLGMLNQCVQGFSSPRRGSATRSIGTVPGVSRTPTTPGRSPEQRLRALAKANEVRLARAQLKRGRRRPDRACAGGRRPCGSQKFARRSSGPRGRSRTRSEGSSGLRAGSVGGWVFVVC